MALNEDVVGAVANTNFKSLGEGPAFFANMMMADSVAHQRRVNAISEGALGTILKLLTEIDPTEAVSVGKTLSNGDLAGQMANLLAALNSGQQGVKAAQTTPPVTP